MERIPKIRDPDWPAYFGIWDMLTGLHFPTTFSYTTPAAYPHT